ncbi:MAG TPA: hypothetical protein VFO19_14490 [Vicinamibacterales bacterium]|jgi:hypothetical protein|nr:hypothetical protein [Vicinamibacterales bacterium]
MAFVHGRPRAGAVALALAIVTAACGSNPTAPSQPVTESLGGSLATGNANYHTFTTKGSGDLSLTLNSIDPTASVTVGVGLGTVSNGACTLQFVNEGFIVGAVWSNTITGAGTYCVAIYDIGQLTQTVTYSMTLVHP